MLYEGCEAGASCRLVGAANSTINHIIENLSTTTDNFLMVPGPASPRAAN